MPDEKDQQIIMQLPTMPMQQNQQSIRSDRSDLIEKIDPKGVVEIIRHKLLGEEWDGIRWVKIEALTQYSLTERGAWEISNLMLGVSSLVTTVSRYTNDHIKHRFTRTVKSSMIMMAAHWREYGVSNSAQFYYVDNILRSVCLAALNQAGDGSIQELLKATVYENRNINTEKKEGGRLRRLLGLA